TCTACEIIGDRGVHNFRAPRNPLDSRDRHDLLDSRNPRNLLDSRDPRDPAISSIPARRPRCPRCPRDPRIYCKMSKKFVRLHQKSKVKKEKDEKAPARRDSCADCHASTSKEILLTSSVTSNNFNSNSNKNNSNCSNDNSNIKDNSFNSNNSKLSSSSNFNSSSSNNFNLSNSESSNFKDNSCNSNSRKFICNKANSMQAAKKMQQQGLINIFQPQQEEAGSACKKNCSQYRP
ncbi:unnamed protein product, partial [Trichogramma brassicae]